MLAGPTQQNSGIPFNTSNSNIPYSTGETSPTTQQNNNIPTQRGKTAASPTTKQQYDSTSLRITQQLHPFPPNSFLFFFFLRRVGKNNAKAHHTSTCFHTCRVSIYCNYCIRNPALACVSFSSRGNYNQKSLPLTRHSRKRLRHTVYETRGYSYNGLFSWV